MDTIEAEERGRPFTSRPIAESPGAEHTPDTPLTLETFRVPDAEARIMPFWFWNTEMEAGLIRRQIHAMAQAGVGGFFLHPRQGLETPYLSEQWFERVRIAVQTAKQLDIQVWLYDEFPYPSGMAGGLLTANFPEYKARTLDYETLEAGGGKPLHHELPLGRVVSALAYPCDGTEVNWENAMDIRKHFGVVLGRELFWRWKLNHCPHSEKRYMADKGRLVLQWTPPGNGAWRLFIGVERELRNFKYYDNYFDPLQPGAAEAFIELTHARYEAVLGNEFGKTIPGFFTDETEPPDWSPELEKELALVDGIDLAESLPAINEDDHPQAHDIRYRLRKCALRLFQERWESPIALWCKKRGLIWGAEKPTWSPDHFRQIAQPTVDAAHQRIGDPPEPLTADLRSNARAAMASAQQARTSIVRCECFHSMGWGATLQDQKWQIDWLAAQGVNRFTPHAFFASISGLRKHDAAPSFFLETPAWPYYRKLADYAARLGLALSRGCEEAPIAVLHPSESLWIKSSGSDQARTEYEWLMNRLMAQHRMFHPVDAQTLLRAEPGKGCLNMGWASYKILLVPPMTAADTGTTQAINAAMEAGVAVLMGEPLGDVTINGTSPRKIFSWPGIVIINRRDQWIPELDACLPQTLSIQTTEMQEAESVWCVQRRDRDDTIIFLANTSPEEQDLRVLAPQRQLNWREWMLESGQTRQLKTDGEGGFLLHLPAYGSALLVGKTEAVPSSEPKINSSYKLPLDGSWKFQTDRPNALRLNRWFAGPSRKEAVTPVDAVPIQYYDKTNETWVRTFDCADNGSAWYRREFTCRHIPSDLALLIEEDAIGGPWTLEINGHSLNQDDFRKVDFHGECKLKYSLAPIARKGRNEIVLHVPDAASTGGLRTPLHLTGAFALRGEGMRTIDHLPPESPYNAPMESGLPHFSGTVTYTRTISFPALGKGTTLVLPGDCEDIFELILDGQSLGSRPWSPYGWTLPFDLEGETEVGLSVTTTLLPFIEGQQWDTRNRRAMSV